VSSQQPFYQVKACANIFLLLSEILTHEPRKDQSLCFSKQQIGEKVKYLMEAHTCKEIDISTIARIIGIITSRLNDIFKAYTSMTPDHRFIFFIIP
jgi:AraC-like DNA-binding protein